MHAILSYEQTERQGPIGIHLPLHLPLQNRPSPISKRQGERQSIQWNQFDAAATTAACRSVFSYP